jgi:hypothetical protein
MELVTDEVMLFIYIYWLKLCLFLGIPLELVFTIFWDVTLYSDRSSLAPFNFAWLTFRPSRWRKYVPPKRLGICAGLHSCKPQDIEFFTVTSVRTSNQTFLFLFVFGDYVDSNFILNFKLSVAYPVTQTRYRGFCSQIGRAVVAAGP